MTQCPTWIGTNPSSDALAWRRRLVLTAEYQMQMVAHHRVAADLDAEEPCQLAQPIKNPVLAVTVILPGIRVHAAEKSPSDASGDAVVNADPFFVNDLAARAGGHPSHSTAPSPPLP